MRKDAHHLTDVHLTAVIRFVIKILIMLIDFACGILMRNHVGSYVSTVLLLQTKTIYSIPAACQVLLGILRA